MNGYYTKNSKIHVCILTIVLVDSSNPDLSRTFRTTFLLELSRTYLNKKSSSKQITWTPHNFSKTWIYRTYSNFWILRYSKCSSKVRVSLKSKKSANSNLTMACFLWQWKIRKISIELFDLFFNRNSRNPHNLWKLPKVQVKALLELNLFE